MAKKKGKSRSRRTGNAAGSTIGDGQGPAVVDAEEVYKVWGSAGGARQSDFELGLMHAQGIEPVPRDEVTAVRFFEQAARAGLVEASCKLGYMYAQGNGVEKDMAKAASLFRTAAEGGDPLAMCSLAALHVESDGVRKDERLAVMLFARACEAGSTTGGLNLGVTYLRGNGVSRDVGRAVEILMAVAEKAEEAEERAVSILATIYRNGVGVVSNRLRQDLRDFLREKGVQV